MNGRMDLLYLLLVITSRTYQSDSKGWSSGMLEYGSGIETIDLCFEGLGGVICNLSVTATADCLMNIKLGSISCPITQDSASPTTTTTTVLCMNQTVAVEKLKTITIQRTQTVNNPTTVMICPTRSSSLGSHLLRSSCGVCTPSTVTATIYQQPPIGLSDVAEVSILITSGVLICLPILTIVIVAYCWVRTRRTLKKKRNGPGVNFDHLAQDSGANIRAMAAVKLNNNPAYESQTPLQEIVVHENTILTTSKPEETRVLTDSTEPAYEIIPLISVQPASITTNVLNNGEGDEYDRLNRDTVQQK